MPKANQRKHIVIVGAGPAGSSLAIRLAKESFRVSLIEKDVFPRHKLCGEFISPECLEQFRELGVADSLLSCGGDRINETVFYSEQGDAVGVPSEWFVASGGGALGLSRSEMDLQMLDKAREVGVDVYAGVGVRALAMEGSTVKEVEFTKEYAGKNALAADLFVDATGRSRILSKMALPKSPVKHEWIGFKAHFTGVDLERGKCEIYFFEGGYGGLSFVEGNAANHCFLIRSDVVKKHGGKPDRVFEEVVLKNKRAKAAFQGSARKFEWLAVSIERFGAGTVAPANNLFAIGDSAAFIDPFTGSGMLLAMQSAKLLASNVSSFEADPRKIAEMFPKEYHRLVSRRLLVCRLMRRLSFSPAGASVVIRALKWSGPVRQLLAKATRNSPTESIVGYR